MNVLRTQQISSRIPVFILLASILSISWVDARGQDLEALRRQVEQQQERVEAQQKAVAEQAEALRRQQEDLERQRQELAELADRMAALSGKKALSEPASTPEEAARAGKERLPTTRERDSVGDLNAEAVSVGDFPGSLRIPGTDRLSLAVGGFIKNVAIVDSGLEGAGPIFLPASIGSALPDEDGNVSVDATLSRLHLDARAPTETGGLRGYFEWDLNASNSGSPGFNLRHAFGVWTSRFGALTLGHTWSTLMDLQILPEGLTEPTVSGAVFQRQAQLRWTQPFTERFRIDLAIEDPSNRDVISHEPVATPSRFPDVVGATQWDWPDRGHVRVTGIFRHLSFGEESANGWGLSTGAHLNVLNEDKIGVSATYGEGMTRYLLGLPGTLGAFVDPDSGSLNLVRGWGGFGTYRHVWARNIRSTFGFGTAAIGVIEQAPEDAFRRSSFGLANVLISPLPYLTYGFEYQYGVREERSGFEQANHRVIFGIQIY